MCTIYDRGPAHRVQPFSVGMPRFGLFLGSFRDFPLFRVSADTLGSGILQFCILTQPTEESAELRATQVGWIALLNMAMRLVSNSQGSALFPRASEYAYLLPTEYFFVYTIENRNERDTYISEFTSISVPNTPRIYFLVGMEHAFAIEEISFTLPLL